MVINFISSASTKLTWILALLLNLVMMIQVHGQAGFINIDCGLTNKKAYVDNILLLPYSSDGDIVEGGQNHKILPQFMANISNEQQKTLRSFPDGSRICYTLQSTMGKKYLLRATFTYGNYDRLNKTQDESLFLFELHIGVNFWVAVNLTDKNPSEMLWKEVLTVAPSNTAYVCLINIGSEIPFLSSLELRPLQDTMYPFVNASVLVSYFQRYRFGNVTDSFTGFTRYPTDNYDRFWESWPLTSYPWINLETTNKVESLPGNDFFNVPLAILQKASTLDTNYSSFSVVSALDPNLDGSNLQLLPIGRFNIYNNDGLMFSNFSPPRFQVLSLYKSGQFRHSDNIFFRLNKTASSSLPPLINGFEAYSLVRMENLNTNSDDVNSMKEVKGHYNLARISWNGDPCSPRKYSWEGLTCNYSRSNQNPRIVSVNLSASGLKGQLAVSFMNMESL